MVVLIVTYQTFLNQMVQKELLYQNGTAIVEVVEPLTLYLNEAVAIFFSNTDKPQIKYLKN